MQNYTTTHFNATPHTETLLYNVCCLLMNKLCYYLM